MYKTLYQIFKKIRKLKFFAANLDIQKIYYYILSFNFLSQTNFQKPQTQKPAANITL